MEFAMLRSLLENTNQWQPNKWYAYYSNNGQVYVLDDIVGTSEEEVERSLHDLESYGHLGNIDQDSIGIAQGRDLPNDAQSADQDPTAYNDKDE